MSDKINVSELFELTGIDRATIRKRLKELPFERGMKNAREYDRAKALDILYKSKAAVEEADNKERKLKAEAEKAELIVAKLRGELVSADAMKTAAAELVKTLYTRIVRVLPSVVAEQLIAKQPIEIEAILRTSLAEVFDELKSLPSNFISVDETVDGDSESI